MTGISAPDMLPRQHPRFLLLYALAMAGGAISYYPFLTLILPSRVRDMAVTQDIATLGYLSFVGALAASVGGILFGQLSDWTGRRRPWVAAGMILSVLMLLLMERAESLWALAALIAAWQMAINMMIGPLSAWGGDVVPDRQKGLLGGLLAFAPAVGALSGAVITLEGLVPADWRLQAVGLLVIACITPLLLWGRARAFPELVTPRGEIGPRDGQALRMWAARLLIQIAEATLFAYLYFWFRSLDTAMTDYEIAVVFSVALCVAVPASLMIGRWADLREQPFKPLMLAALGASAGLLWMSFSPDIGSAKASFVLFSICTNVFLALHSGQYLRILPRPQHRGRDVGIFNLTNTIPSLIMPWLTIAVVPSFGFDALFVVLAGLALAAAVLLKMISPAKTG